MSTRLVAGLVVAAALLANAQYGAGGPPGGGSSGGTTSGGASSGSGAGGSSGSSSSSSSSTSDSTGLSGFFGQVDMLIPAHAAMATLAFGFLFPVGGIIVRVAPFRAVWLVHALIQMFAYVLYIAAFGIGVYMAINLNALTQAHAIIGMIIFGLLFFQPFLGLLHHTAFKKHSRRVVWSHGHIWLGRIILTMGVINGGLGLQMANRLGILPPARKDIIGYSVVAGFFWLAYAVAVIFGETRRSGSSAKDGSLSSPAGTKEGYREGESRQYA